MPTANSVSLRPLISALAFRKSKWLSSHLCCAPLLFPRAAAVVRLGKGKHCARCECSVACAARPGPSPSRHEGRDVYLDAWGDPRPARNGYYVARVIGGRHASGRVSTKKPQEVPICVFIQVTSRNGPCDCKKRCPRCSKRYTMTKADRACIQGGPLCEPMRH